MSDETSALGAGRRVPVRDDLGLSEGYHSPQLDVRVRLNTNEAPLPPPAAWVEAVQHAVADIAFHRYPSRAAGSLRAALAAHHGVDQSMVFAANGSNEVLQSILLAFGGPGRAAAVFEPTYALHSHIAEVTGTTVATGERDADFVLPADELDRVIGESAPAVTFLCSPNNPTGRAEPREAVERALETAPGLVVVDEAYGQFASWSALSLVGPDVPLVVVRTFSKTWAMAGARLGYLVGPEWVVEGCERVVLPYHLDALKQEAGRLALDFVGEMEERVAAVVSERERIVAAFDDLAVDHWPSQANFVLFRPRAGGGGRAVWQAMVERGVLVRDCSTWPRLDGCLRVTVGTPEENDAFLTALRAALGDER